MNNLERRIERLQERVGTMRTKLTMNRRQLDFRRYNEEA